MGRKKGGMSTRPQWYLDFGRGLWALKDKYEVKKGWVEEQCRHVRSSKKNSYHPIKPISLLFNREHFPGIFLHISPAFPQASCLVD